MIVGIAMQEQPMGAQSQPTALEFQDETAAPVEDYVPDAVAVTATADSNQPPQLVQPHLSAVNGGEAAPMMYTSQQLMGQHHPHLGMIGLEQQFAQFGLHPSEHGSSLADSGHDSSENNTENYEGEETEEEPLKLFVGQIPKALNEEDIFPTFDGFGPLKDVAVIRDKHTGIHRGCAFVTYWSTADAERAREALHDKFTFPGGKRPAQVKPAEPATAPENKLFIGMLSRKAGEEDVRDLFSRFGEIREIYMIRSADGSSKCAAFLRFVNRDAAEKAIEQLHGIEVMEGSQRPLIVKFADTKQQRNQRLMRNMHRQEMMAMGAPSGYYPTHPAAHHHHHHHQGPPMSMPMHPGAATHYPIPPPHGGQAYPPYGQAPPHHYMYAPAAAYGQVPPAYPYQQQQQQQQQPRSEPRGSNPRPREGPPGANLFVYHLPHDLTDADLATAFNPFGNVVSAKVYVDKYTGESKGFGFVSYDSVVAASSAIEQMNGFQIGNKRLKVQHKRVHGAPSGQQPPQQQREEGTQSPG